MQLVGKLALAAMLFAQAAFALAACDLISRTPMHAFAPAGAEARDPNCHETGAGANLCLTHCQTENQSLDKPQVKVPALALQPVTGARAPQEPLNETVAFARHPVAWAAPPPRILFQSFLI
jgi:hypothetical protein